MGSLKSGIHAVAALFKKCEDEKTELYNHIVVGLDIDPNGRPVSKCLHTKSSPYELLGMIDNVIMMLEETRDEIREKLSAQDRMAKLVSKLPDDIGSKINELELRMRDATGRMDIDEMNAIQKELDDLLEGAKGNLKDLVSKLRDLSSDDDDDSDDDEDDEEDFTAKDFMGGL